jgi:CBS-domain-containing membrane protein
MLLGARSAPNPIQSGELTAVRVEAAVVAVALTVLAGFALRASHPPAVATTLLVALGAIATPQQVLATIAGVVLVTLFGEWVRRVRLDRTTPSERRAPARSVTRLRLRGG